MIKKQARSWFVFYCAILLAGFCSSCTDRGPRALLDGDKLMRQGKYPEAIDKFTDAVDRLPQNAQAWNHLGLAYHYERQYSKAIESYSHALRLDRNLAIARYNLGCCYLEQNKFSAATDEFITYTKLEPRQLDGWLKLGTAQLRQGEQLSGAERGKWLEAARKTFDYSTHVTLTPEAFNALGVIEVQRYRPKDSLKFFNAALQKQANYPPALLNQAIVYHSALKDHRTALQKYRQFLNSKPRSSQMAPVEEIVRQLDLELNQAGARETNSGRVASALIRATNNSVATSNPKKEIRQETASSLNENQIQKAAIAGDSLPPEKLKPVAAPELAASPRTPTAASKPALNRYKYLSPARPAAGNRTAAARAYDAATEAQRNGNRQKALEHFKAAAKSDPAFFEAYFKLGLVSYELVDYNASLHAYELALAVSPDSAAARYNFALALQKAGFLQDAAFELEKVVEQNPTEHRAHLTLANLYVQLRQKDRARQHYARVLELEPQHAEALSIRYWLAQNP